MNEFSDWKCGAMSDEEFRDLTNREARQDAYIEKLAERFNYRCPYTDDPCRDFLCEDCEIEAREREWMQEIDKEAES